jgi:hypothetical protein
MDATSQPQNENRTIGIRSAWNQYRLLFYSALIGVAGGLGAQFFVWILNLAERLLLIGIAGYQPPEPGGLNPEPVIGPWGLWLIPLAVAARPILSGGLTQSACSMPSRQLSE